MNQRIGILDLGTNTFHLLIAERRAHKWDILHRYRQAVKLGQGGINQSTLLPEAQARAIEVLKHFAALMDHHGVDRALAFGTSAIRVATNRQEFLNRVQAETGIEVKVLSGDEEAQFIFYGVQKALGLQSGRALIVDIGGGSVEFILTTEGSMHWHTSLEIGAQRLLEMFQHHDPILPEEITALMSYLEQQLEPVLQALQHHKPTVLAGSSGTFDTLSDIYCLKHGIAVEPDAPETPLTLEGFEEIYALLTRMNRAERLGIPGMIEMRVDMIVVACCLIKFLLTRHPFSAIRVSSYAMKEGILERIDHL
jgi:exopolyphosphatase/guanosine-5'-triphosphate,3'-diphosphate pyrophosphatase